MPRHLTVATVIESHAIASEVAFLFLIEIDIVNTADVLIETVRVVNNTENINFGGVEYVAGNFKLDIKQSAAEEPTIKLSAYDPTGVLRQRMEQFEGGVGFTCRLIIVNSARLSDPAEMTEEFTILGGSAKGYNLSFTMGTENPLRLQFPNRVQYADRCSVQYKGTRCKYAGALGTCDYTFSGPNGCVAHANSANYGGFRGMKNLAV
jgi:hypothetical protein